MFSGPDRLSRRTPTNGINRRDFIAHLVEEYHTTSNIEAQEQVTANLANFAYDPINWNYLKDAEALQLFFELIESPNQRLQLHASAGLCNIALDPHTQHFITLPNNTQTLLQFFLKTQHTDILINLVTLLYQIVSTSVVVKQQLVTPEILKKINQLRQNSTDRRLNNLALLFHNDFGTRTEVTNLTGATSGQTEQRNAIAKDSESTKTATITEHVSTNPTSIPLPTIEQLERVCSS